MTRLRMIVAVPCFAILLASAPSSRGEDVATREMLDSIFFSPQAATGLLRTDLVRQELEVTENERALIREVGAEYQVALDRPRTDAGDLAAFDRARKAGRLKLAEILGPTRFERLLQLLNQVYSIDFFDDLAVVRGLRLTETQLAKIKSIKVDQLQRLAALGGPQVKFFDPINRPQEFRDHCKWKAKHTAEIVNRTVRDCMQTLTPEQQQQVRKLRGKEIDLAVLLEQRELTLGE